MIRSILFFLLILPVHIICQNENNSELDQLIDLALKNNHSLRQSKIEFEKAKEQVWEAYGSSLFPRIDGTVTYQRAIERARFIIETPFFSGSFPVGSQNTLTAQIYAEQPLFTGAMFLAVNIARTFADISMQGYLYTRSDVVMKVKEAYYTFLLASSFIDLAQLQLKRAEENLANTKSMYNAGLAAEYDFIRANVQYQNLIPALTEAVNQKKLALNNLKLILGTDLESEINIDEKLVFDEHMLPDFEEGLNELFLKNKIIRQSVLDSEMKELIKSYQFTEHFPKVTAFGTWQTQTQEEDKRAFNDWRYFNSLSVGVTMKVPIFSGFTIDSKVEQADLDLKKSLEGLASTKKALRNEYENVYLTIVKIKEQIAAFKASMEESNKGYDIAVKRFNSGLGTQLEVTDALLNVTNSEINYLRAVHSYYLNNAALNHLLGKEK